MAKKTLKCVPWLTHILNETLPKNGETAQLKNRPVKLYDGSCVKQEGSKGATIRVHMCYDLTHRQMDEVLVTDHHTAESFKHFNIGQGDICMADAGFGKGKNLEYIVSCQADAILRIAPGNVCFSKDSNGKEKINMITELDYRKNIVELNCFIHTENKKHIPVRVIASRLPEDKIVETIKRKKRKASKNKTKLRDETLIYAQWVILITSLDDSHSAEEILKLYRVRWQIELLFKRIKQFFKVTRVKAANVKHSKTLVLIWLIVWALTERQTTTAEAYLIQNQADIDLYSPWSMSGFFFHKFKALLCSLVGLCLDVDMLDIFKRLRNHKSCKENQFVDFCFS